MPRRERGRGQRRHPRALTLDSMVGGVDPGKRDRDTIFSGNPGSSDIRFLNGSSVLGITRRETVPACFVTDYWFY